MALLSCRNLLVVIILGEIACEFAHGYRTLPQWTYTCSNTTGRCKRSTNSTTSTSLNICRLTCGQYGSLWPLPTGRVQLSSTVTPFNPKNFQFDLQTNDVQTKNFLQLISEEFLKKFPCDPCGPGGEVHVSIATRSNDLRLAWSTDESYNLTVTTLDSKVHVQINSSSVFGTRHALETLSQLVTSVHANTTEGFVIISKASVSDSPAYSHRGLLLDTARNYLPITAIKKQINAMAINKMNVLHLHLTDSQSFPFVSESVPKLARYGAYSEKHTYRPSEIEELTKYALVKGVKIILEFDMPSHSGNGWQWGNEDNLGDLAVCVNSVPWRSYCIQPPCGQLNPANKNLYVVLGNLMSDVLKIVKKDDPLHLGGDEVFLPCWNSSTQIIDYLTQKKKDRSEASFMDLWAEFQAKLLNIIDERTNQTTTPIILWSSSLTNPDIITKHLDPARYIIQTWVPSKDDLPNRLLQEGYKLIVSTKDAWYLDHGFWGTTQYHSWKVAYNNRIVRHRNVLGGEACMWGEYVNDGTIEGKIWPRTASVAERLWSNPKLDARAAEVRMYRHLARLWANGVKADSIFPLWCMQNEGECF